MGVLIKVDDSGVQVKVDEVLNKLPDVLEEALEKACLLVENSAKENCPVGSGELRASIEHNVDGTTGTIGTNVEYAPYVEFGTGIYSSMGNGRQTPWSYQDAQGNWHTTSGQTPQPYLKPALEQNLGQITECFKGLLG